MATRMCSSEVILQVAFTVTFLLSILISTTGTTKSYDDNAKKTSVVIPNSPRFIVKLLDDSLLCLSVDGFELFTFNLITSNYVVVNGFLNVTEVTKIDKSLFTNSTDEPVFIRGFTDVGMLVKVVDSRWKGGKRIFKHSVNGGIMKAKLDGFGEMDIRKGSVLFGVNKGHSNIESQVSKYETFKVVMDRPALDLTAVSSDQHTFNVYVENPSGLRTISMHGLIGQFYSPKVRISISRKELTRADGQIIPLEEGPIWDTVRDGIFADRSCWYPQQGFSAIEGEPWEYVVEHLLSTTFKHTVFRQ